MKPYKSSGLHINFGRMIWKYHPSLHRCTAGCRLMSPPGLDGVGMGSHLTWAGRMRRNIDMVPHMVVNRQRHSRANNGHKLNAQRGFIRDHRLLWRAEDVFNDTTECDLTFHSTDIYGGWYDSGCEKGCCELCETFSPTSGVHLMVTGFRVSLSIAAWQDNWGSGGGVDDWWEDDVH